MPTVGRACLILALGVAVYGIGAALYGTRPGRRAWVLSARRAIYVVAGLATVAFALLESAFLRSDFSLSVVAAHSSTSTPTFYKATAAWSSQEGSLLLWVWLLSLWSSVILFITRRRMREIQPYATAVLLGFAAFFLFLQVFFANPFAVLSPAPIEGAGLNPLLRHPSMMFHPPALYSGYTLFTIPFAFAVGALVTRQIDAEWIRSTRRFTLAAWGFLGIGILLGARWSYTELGWGGYWAWDPVENAALMPWLCGTAFLHSMMIQEKRGMLKVWNASLVLATGILAILGTFLVRSGILDSIHAFGASTLGVPFLVLIGVLVAGSATLIVSRRDALRSEHRIDALLSRESMFLLNNLVIVGLCFVIFLGTFFPLISEALTGQKAALGPPWFNLYTRPLAIALVLLSGIGPVISWRRVTAANLRRNFLAPVGAALATLVALLAVGGISAKPWALALFCMAAFVFGTVVQEYWRGLRARRAMASESPPAALVALVRRNRRRYGGYLIHLGVAVLLVGVAASSTFQHVQQITLSPGQSARVDGYSFRYLRPTSEVSAERISFGAQLDVWKGSKHVGLLSPSRSYYPSTDVADLGLIGRFFNGDNESQVGLSAGAWRDVWTAVEPDTTMLQPLINRADRSFPNASPTVQGVLIAALAVHYRGHAPPATFRLIVSPLVSWIWVGGLIVLAGTLVVVWPAPTAVRGRVRGLAAARLARDLGRA